MIFAFNSFLRTTIVTIGSALVGAIIAWWLTANYKDAKYQAEIATMRENAVKSLQIATNRAIAIERANVQLAQKLEISNAKHRKELDRLFADNRRLVRELGGLRDPFAKSTSSSCAMSSGSATTSSSVDFSASGELSAELTEFLLSEARRADEAAAYALTCFEWVKRLVDFK